MTSKLLSILVASTLAATSFAGAPPTAAPTPAEPALPEFKWKEGPAKIDLGHQIDLDLPADFGFLSQPEADRLLQSMGSFQNPNLVGVIAPNDPTQAYFVVIDWKESGYVKDDEKIDAAELLKSFRENQEQANTQRVAKGFPALTIDNWAEPPHYDNGLHHVVWGLTVTGNHKSVNYSTRILGRRGYVSLNLVTSTERFAQDRSTATKLLAATTFRQGARYQDFDKSKGDKVAEFGLVGLVLGGIGVAKLVKIGLLAKFWKVIAVGIAGAFAAIKKFFSSKNTPPAA